MTASLFKAADQANRGKDEWLTPPGITSGGYGNQSKIGPKKNHHRETIWFSPNCNRSELNLFAQ